MNAEVTKMNEVNSLKRGDGSMETRLYFNESFLTAWAQLALTALATAFFIKWWALAWFAVMFTLICVRGSSKVKTTVPEGIAGAIAVGLGSTFYAAAAIAAWIVGGPEAGFVAGAMLGTQAMHGTTFFSASRLHFVSHFAPCALMVVAAPFLLADNLVPVLVTLLCVTQASISAMAARANRIQMTEQLLRIQSEMEAARDSSLAKSQFMAMMSHELRTPLNAVIGYAELLEEELTEEGRKGNASDAGRIRRSARNLLALINEILDYSKIEAGRMEVHLDHVDVRLLIDDVQQTVRHIANAHGTAIIMEIAPEAQAVRTDGMRLRQCLLNLMSNAAKFTERGEIRVRAVIEEDAEGGLLRIDVADTGCGISEANAARLFQPFTQVDGALTRKRDGTGLGLVITKRLSELMGGGVTLVSAANVGSTFTLRVRDHARTKIETANTNTAEAARVAA